VYFIGLSGWDLERGMSLTGVATVWDVNGIKKKRVEKYKKGKTILADLAQNAFSHCFDKRSKGSHEKQERKEQGRILNQGNQFGAFGGGPTKQKTGKKKW